MTRLLTASLFAVSMIATPVLAGDTKMKNADGMELKINCKNSGCKVRGKKPGGRWGKVENTAGGRKNFEKLVAKYQAMGFE